MISWDPPPLFFCLMWEWMEAISRPLIILSLGWRLAEDLHDVFQVIMWTSWEAVYNVRPETGPEEGRAEGGITKGSFWNKSEERISEVRPSWSSQCLRRWLRWALTGAKWVEVAGRSMVRGCRTQYLWQPGGVEKVDLHPGIPGRVWFRGLGEGAEHRQE